MSGKKTKISFLGDITCDRPLLEASRTVLGKYDFAQVFSEVRTLLADSDYAIANFEAVCAGSRNDYRNEFLLYNCPDEMVPAMKENGIDFVTTANNHCLDQGIAGLKKTLGILDKYGIRHTGTFVTPEDRSASQNIITVNGIRIAILAYTSGTNESNTGVILDSSNDFLVGLLRKQVDNAKQSRGLKGVLARNLSAKQRRMLQRVISRIKLRMGISYFKPYTDHITQADNPENPCLIQVKKEIAEAKRLADIVVVCPHMGGQFNTEPGTYSTFLIDYLKECGADIVAGNHPHVVQRAFYENDFAAAYAIGSFNLSVSADYIVHESLPEYSMVLHVYMDSSTKCIDHVSFSILKIIEDGQHKIIVYPIHQLPNNLISDQTRTEVTEIYNRITGKDVDRMDICEEYAL